MSVPANWITAAAEDFCLSVRDGTHDSPKFVEHGHPLVTSKNIKGGQIDLSTSSLISHADFDEINRRSKVDQWDVLFSMIGTIGEVCIVETPVVEFAIKNVGLFKCGSEEDGRWLSLWLRSPAAQSHVAERLRGASQQYIPLGELRKLPIPIPIDQREKQSIIAVLQAYDDLIATNQRRIALLEDAARQIYREWFVHLRFPGHESVPVKDGVPQGWVLRNLFDVCDVDYGFPFKADQFNTDGIGMPAIRIRDILNVSTSTYTAEQVDSSYIVKRGDFLIGMDGNFHMNYWAGEDALLVQRVCRVRPKDESLRALVGQALREPIKYFESTIQGATVAHLGAKHLQQIELLIPAAMDAHLDYLNQALWQQIQLRETNRKLAHARDLLLPKLMSGQLDVSGIRLPEEIAA